MPEAKEERSEELEEILGRIPSWPIRWGSALLLFLVLAFLGIAWMVRYPKVVEGKGVLIQEPEPIRLPAPSSGAVKKIRDHSGIPVKKGEPLLFIGNREDLRTIREWERKSRDLLQNLQEIKPFPSSPILEEGNIEALEKDRRRTRKAMDAYRKALERTKQTQREDRIRERIELARKILSSRIKRKKSSKKDLREEHSELLKAEKLFKKGAISQKDLRKRKERFRQKEEELHHLEGIRIRQKMQIKELQQERERIVEKERGKKDKREKALRRALESFLSRIELWKEQHMVRAPTGGRMTELLPLKDGQRVKEGEELLAIIPSPSHYVIRTQLPARAMGEIEPGTAARMELRSLPREEYGVLKGKVTRIADLPEDTKYSVRIGLEKGLRSSSGKRVDPKGRMNGTVELITKKRSLLEKILTP